jgi:hypothetical protein
MTLLLPELERQLRAAVRSRQAATAAADGAAAAPRSRRRRPSFGSAITLASVLATLAIAALIVLEVRPASRTQSGQGTHPGSAAKSVTSQMPHGTYCGEPLPRHGVRRRLSVLARGRDSAWVVSRLRVALPGTGTFTTVALDLGGRLFLACDTGAPVVSQFPGSSFFWTLNGDPPPRAGHDTLQIRGVPADAIERRRVAGGTFFLAVLPRSLCHARSLSVVLRSAGSTTTQTFPLPKCVTPSSPPLLVRPPAGLRPAQVAEFRRGEAVLEQSGCLACHQLARSGNNGPGRNLTDIGAKLRRAELAIALSHPKAPMPTFKALARSDPKQWSALLFFLSHLTR